MVPNTSPPFRNPVLLQRRDPRFEL